MTTLRPNSLHLHFLPKTGGLRLKVLLFPNSTTSVPPLSLNGIIYTDETDKANILNDFFQSQTVLNEENAVLPDLHPPASIVSLESIIFTADEFESVLKLLPIGKASGPDGLSNRLLRELSNELAKPYQCLFNQSIRMGTVASSYKEANVSPVPKKGDLSIVSNYRPISLLNAEEKLLERLMFKYLFIHLWDNNLLSSLQSGFIPGDSTVNQLTFLYNTFCQALDSGKEVRAVFCDISKAFDRVWHAELLLKLKTAGVAGSVLTWFKSYLSDRRQRVRVVLPGANSNWSFIRADVPQGSILGPLLFLLYMILYLKLARIFDYSPTILVCLLSSITLWQLLANLTLTLRKYRKGQQPGLYPLTLLKRKQCCFLAN